MPRNSWSVLLPVVCLLPMACQSSDSTPAGWKSHQFGKGQVTVASPADYRESTEPDETLVLTPPNDPGVKLRFSVYNLDGPGSSADAGVEFVRDQAKKKNLAVTEKSGKVIMTETNTAEENGVKVENHFWQIGFQNVVVVMGATVDAAKKDDAVVKECLEKVVPAVIDSLKKL